MRYSITLSYDGSQFCGWQVQPGEMTVQESLEKALSTLLGTDIAVTGAGRTDSKVNAIGYVAHFDSPTVLDTEAFGYKLNAILPRAIVVQSVREAPEDFHARFGATRREYTYFLNRKRDPFVEKYSYLCGYPLDIDAMNEAARSLLGRHDFRCFEKVGADNKTSLCTVYEAFWSPYTPAHVSLMGYSGAVGKPGRDSSGADYLYFRISADRFLRNMVRATVGSLIEVGRGRRSIGDFTALVLPPDYAGTQATRSDAGESVPGHALFLSKVEYP